MDSGERSFSSMSGRSPSSRPSSSMSLTGRRKVIPGAALSSKTRRILQQLEKMSTPSPVKAAQRMSLGQTWDPQRQMTVDSPAMRRSTVAATTGTMNESSSESPRPLPGRLHGPPLSSFHTPTQARIVPRVSSLQPPRSAQPYWTWRRVPAAADTAEGTGEHVIGTQERTAGGKMKVQVTRLDRSSNIYSASEVTDDYQLGDSVIPLPIAAERVPSRGFLSRSSPHRPTPTHGQTDDSSFSFATPFPLSSSRFSFAAPHSLTGPRHNHLQKDVQRPEVRRKSPMCNGPSSSSSVPVKKEVEVEEEEEEEESLELLSEDDSTDSGEEQPSTTAQSTTTFEGFQKAQKWECDGCHFRNHINETHCVTCLTKKPKHGKAGKTQSSDIQIKKPADEKWRCKKCQLENTPNAELCICCKATKDWVPPAKKSTQSSGGKWSCNACMISNDRDKTVCAACGTANPGAKWECEACMVKNEGSANTCVACTTPKPGSAKSSNSSSSFKPTVFGAPSGGKKWECDACMVRNESSAETCVACTTPKPGNAPAKSNTSSNSSSFKPTVFGVPASGEKKWECEVCMVRNEASSNTCVACTTPKPGTAVANSGASSSFKPTVFGVPAAQPPVFGFSATNGDGTQPESKDWSCTTCFVTNAKDARSCVSCQTPKPGNQFKPVSFGFGLSSKRHLESEDKSGNPEKKTVRFGEPISSTKLITPLSTPTLPLFGLPAATSATPSTNLTTTSSSMFGIKPVTASAPSNHESSKNTSGTAPLPVPQFLAPNASEKKTNSDSSDLFEPLSKKQAGPIKFGEGLFGKSVNAVATTTASTVTTTVASTVAGTVSSGITFPKLPTSTSSNPVPSSDGKSATLLFGDFSAQKKSNTSVTTTKASSTPLFSFGQSTATSNTPTTTVSTPSNAFKSFAPIAPTTQAASLGFQFGKSSTDGSAGSSLFKTVTPSTETPKPTPPFVFGSSSTNTLSNNPPKLGQTPAPANLFSSAAAPVSSSSSSSNLFGSAAAAPNTGSGMFGGSLTKSATAPLFGSPASHSKPDFGTPSLAKQPTLDLSTPGAGPTPGLGNPSLLPAQNNASQGFNFSATGNIAPANPFPFQTNAVPGNFQFGAAAPPAASNNVIQFSSAGSTDSPNLFSATSSAANRTMLKAKRKMRR